VRYGGLVGLRLPGTATLDELLETARFSGDLQSPGD
jgi:hypothetical protein